MLLLLRVSEPWEVGPLVVHVTIDDNALEHSKEGARLHAFPVEPAQVLGRGVEYFLVSARHDGSPLVLAADGERVSTNAVAVSGDHETPVVASIERVLSPKRTRWWSGRPPGTTTTSVTGTNGAAAPAAASPPPAPSPPSEPSAPSPSSAPSPPSAPAQPVAPRKAPPTSPKSPQPVKSHHPVVMRPRPTVWLGRLAPVVLFLTFAVVSGHPLFLVMVAAAAWSASDTLRSSASVNAGVVTQRVGLRRQMRTLPLAHLTSVDFSGRGRRRSLVLKGRDHTRLVFDPSLWRHEDLCQIISAVLQESRSRHIAFVGRSEARLRKYCPQYP